jgi:hypothetical protein
MFIDRQFRVLPHRILSFQIFLSLSNAYYYFEKAIIFFLLVEFGANNEAKFVYFFKNDCVSSIYLLDRPTNFVLICYDIGYY